ncbi:MAG: hypothetical protein RR224_12395 [Clostridia bacterium]
MKQRKPTTTRKRLWHMALTLFVAALMIVIPCTVLAEEMGSWKTYVKEIRMQEEAKGFYADWDITDKEALIEALVQMKAMRESAATRRLVESSLSVESRHALADQIMLRFLGGGSNDVVRKDGIRAVRWNTITNVIMGDPSTWTLEENVWYQQVTNMFGHKDPDTLVLPVEGDLTEDEAMEIARTAIAHAYGLPEDLLDGFLPSALLYATENDFNARPDYRRWSIQFLSYQYGDEIGFDVYAATVDENGHVIGDFELGTPHVQAQATESKTRLDHATPVIVQKFREYAEKEGNFSSWQWPYETKAAYCHDIRERVLVALENGETNALINPSFCQEPVREIVNSTAFAYGLPEESHLQFEKALGVAQSTITDEYGILEDTLAEYSVYTSFDVTASERPLWKFVFCPHSFENMEDVLLFKVEINAYSGKKTTVQAIEWDRLFLGTDDEQLLY